MEKGFNIALTIRVLPANRTIGINGLRLIWKALDMYKNGKINYSKLSALNNLVYFWGL